LLGEGANLHGTGSNGNMPIHFVAMLVTSSDEDQRNTGINVMQLLFKEISDLTLTNYDGNSAMDLCGEAKLVIESKLLTDELRINALLQR